MCINRIPPRAMEKYDSAKALLLLNLAMSAVLIGLTGCHRSNSPDTDGSQVNMEGLEAKKSNVDISALERQWSYGVRGLSQVDDRIAWASGTKGSFMRCLDGVHWEADSISGYTHLDFRDIEAFDANKALIMAAGDEGRILRTEDGGQTWTEVYTNMEEGIFLDGMDFNGAKGYCIGDPLNGFPFILYSEDEGRHWSRIGSKQLPEAIPGEGSYAASGSTIVYTGGMAYAAYGGDSLIRVLRKPSETKLWQSIEVPMRIGEGCGIFSMAFLDAANGIAVGGSYLDSLAVEGHAALTSDSGRTWQALRDHGPMGYRSSIAYSPNGHFYMACGRSGVDISYDGGGHWESLSHEGYFTLSLGDQVGWLMGRNGRLARLTW